MAKAPKKDAAPKAPAVVATVAEIKLDLPTSATKEQITKAIDSIKLRGAKLDISIHSAALACLVHAEKHNDATLVNRLLLAMPKSSRRNSLAAWFVNFGTLSQQSDEAKKDAQPLMLDKSKALTLDDAKAKPFWDFRNVREGTGEGFKFDDYIGGVMKKLAAIAADTKSVDGARARATLHALAALGEAAALPAPAVALEEGAPIPARRASDHEAPATVQ